MQYCLGAVDVLPVFFFMCFSGSVSSRAQQPSRFDLLLEKLRELTIRCQVYSVSRYAKNKANKCPVKLFFFSSLYLILSCLT